jgi:protein TonB
MTAALAARASRQSLVLVAIAGLHFAAFVLIASGLSGQIRLPAPTPPAAWVLPKPVAPEPILRPGDPEPAGYDPRREPLPVIRIPSIREPTPSPEAVQAPAGPDAGSGPESQVIEIQAPALRTRGGRLATLVEACYPPASRRLGEEGRAVARVVIDAGGRLRTWSVDQTSGFPRLDAAVDCVLRRLDFVPGRRNGQAMEAAVLIPIVFRLN